MYRLLFEKVKFVTIAGIDGNGQSELVYGITGMMPIDERTGDS